MPRERWFYAKDLRRVGPISKRQLVESLLALPDPRGSLVWRHGLPAWTPAREVPEIETQLAHLVKEETSPPPEAAPAAPQATAASAPAGGRDLRAASRGGRASSAPQPNIALYFGGLGALLVVAVVSWLLWSRSNGNENPQPGPRTGGGTSAGGAASSAASPGAGGGPGSGAGAGPGTGGGPAAFAGWSDQEAELPTAELRRLRGIGAWSGDRLTITLYNGSPWRVTEILVRTSRLSGEDFVDADTPKRLLPVAATPVDAGTDELLNKVVPDRKKPGVNPLDTMPFQAAVGPPPEAYRWRIEGARGYPPRQ